MILRHDRRVRVAACLLAAAMLSACGTRLPDEAFSSEQVVAGQGVSTRDASGSGGRTSGGTDPSGVMRTIFPM